ncbi:MAG: M23 family metallopeptidase [Gemmatimonadaceae bacterium]
MADRRMSFIVPPSIAAWHGAARRRQRAARVAVAGLAALSAFGLALAPRDGRALVATAQLVDGGDADRLRAALIAFTATDSASDATVSLPKPFMGRLALADVGEPTVTRTGERRAAKARHSAAAPTTAREAAPGAAPPAAHIRAPLAALLPPAGVLASRFSSSRRHPILGIRRPHLGVDLRAPYGTPILAPSAGVVRHVAREPGFGLMVEIDHGGGIVTRYAHCSRALVREGQPVARGERIAAVGRSGITSGPHLHYEVHVDGRSVDPLTFAFPDWAAIPDSLGIPDPSQP